MRYCLKLALFAVVALQPGLAQSGDPQDTETAQTMTQAVADFHETLAMVLKIETGTDNGSTAFTAKLALLTPAVDRLFDLENAARLSVGRGWRKFTPDQREVFQNALGRLVASTYASRFKQDRGQRFEHLTTQLVGGSWVVRTTLVRPGADPVPLDYYLREAGVFNVLAGGVSDASLRRAEYAAVLKRAGFDALLAHVEAAADAMTP